MKYLYFLLLYLLLLYTFESVYPKFVLFYLQMLLIKAPGSSRANTVDQHCLHGLEKLSLVSKKNFFLLIIQNFLIFYNTKISRHLKFFLFIKL